jgi:hypothetical protein
MSALLIAHAMPPRITLQPMRCGSVALWMRGFRVVFPSRISVLDYLESAALSGVY